MRKGITLIEIIIAIAIAAIVSGLIIVALNPAGQLAQARNLERKAHLNAILNGIRQNIADNRTGALACAAGDIPTSTVKRMATGAGNFDIAGCLIPTYLNVLPFDPSASSSYFNTLADYNSGYNVTKSSSTGQVTVSAPYAEFGQVISVTR